jgi:arginyl-tRNA synthetase
LSDPVSELRAAVQDAAATLRDSSGADAAPPVLERPPKPEFGDYSTNAAMLLAPSLGEQPRGVAERLAGELDQLLGERLERVEVAGPGFLNLFLSDRWYRRAAAELWAAGEDLGRPPERLEERVLIEFVSANPTGPLTAASGRHAAYGDAVARALELAGAAVGREYYINDRGGQIELFAASLATRMRNEPAPEGGYQGEYVAALAARLEAEGVDPTELEALARRGVELIAAEIRKTLERYGVSFDRWFSERSLYESGAVEQALADLRAAGHVYESEGAIWLRASAFGDDKDRVLVRSDGEPTYYLSDVAYHREKLERDPEGHLINVLGADHHGYVERLKAAIAALGFDPERLEVAIMQLVHVVERGERAQMSKRKGEFVTLDELLDDIGSDATRFFMLQRSHDTPVDLDLELARQTSSENPVYYVQYAHARIASILRKAGDDAAERAAALDLASASAPVEPAERALIKRICELPVEVRETAARRAPHRLCAYATATAADFHAFYRDCQVVGAEGEGVEEARLALCLLTKRAIATTLGLLGISAPERM